jgi:hypothetical protein
VFHFEVTIEVFHADRELEFILVKQYLESLYSTGVLQLDYRSCEMMADELFDTLRTKYGPHRYYEIEVSEDGENGARMIYPPGAILRKYGE